MTPILIAALLLAPATGDDAFCEALKQIVAAAPGDYRAVAGAPDGKDSHSWLGTAIPDIDSGREVGCFVWLNDPQTSRFYYYCMTNRQDDAASDTDVAALADRAARCFGAEVRKSTVWDQSALGYPLERRIALPPLEISVKAQRDDDIVIMSRRPAPILPYLFSGGASHHYSLSLEIRTIDPKINGE